VHDGGGDEDAAVGPAERLPAARNRYAVLGSVHVPVDDVVLAAHEHARGPLKAFGRGHLAAGDLYEQVRARICRLAPLANNVVEPKVKFVVCQHLPGACELHRTRDQAEETTFSAAAAAAPVGSWSASA
jgi:hypothetical protein